MYLSLFLIVSWIFNTKVVFKYMRKQYGTNYLIGSIHKKFIDRLIKIKYDTSLTADELVGNDNDDIVAMFDTIKSLP